MGMIGQSPAFRAVEQLIARIAVYSAPVLIQGETGTGKELAARAIHYASPRRNYPFVPVNCGSLPDSLIENELFGHARGAFTDARADQLGLIGLANRGTLFLDEVDLLSYRGQVTLLRFLQDQHFRPLGGGGEQLADVRIIAASNRSLTAAVASKDFRQDLFYRLKVLELDLPPLRERRADIPVLANYFVERASVQFGKPVLPVEGDTLAWFAQYEWPGNVRELEHLICRGFLLAEGGAVSIDPPTHLCDLKPGSAERNAQSNYVAAKRRAINDFEKRFLAQLIDQAGGNISAAARLCGTERRHLGRLLRKHQLTKQVSLPR
jgi:DNA-binding NtrC family response regulator